MSSRLTPAQLTTLAAHIRASTDPAVVSALANGADNELARLYNLDAVPAFVVWRSNVGITETGKQFVGTEWAGMTSANHTRLQTVAQWLAGGYNAALADIRAMFDDIWSGAGGVLTRARLLTMWKRNTRLVERVFATGTGSIAVPGVLVFEGEVSGDDIASALRPQG